MEERPLRVAFCGNDPWSVPSLTAIASSAHEIVLVVTAEPKPAGRGSALRPTAVAEASRELDLDPFETGTIRTGPGLEALRDASPDVLGVVAYVMAIIIMPEEPHALPASAMG